jgi:hypothetical protein
VSISQSLTKSDFHPCQEISTITFSKSIRQNDEKENTQKVTR